ncbi:ASCH domain-containing protein [Parabacteroides johnsonii]|jgi:hypothetical protein|uniref:ASCH domain-containing protein n=1 Tax=Parabacteroides johnsonii TaxID=387661 RepID=UPI002432B977|nr:ASCH domain-containing protein [Parabacteroides johnsonii]
MQNILISIQPQYVNKIIAKTKKVEFRKKFTSRNIDKVYIYSSSPQKKIVAYFKIQKIDKDTPSHIWNKYKMIGGIDKVDFFNYYTNKNEAIAILFEELYVLRTPINPYHIFPDFYPPQNYMFIEDILCDK